MPFKLQNWKLALLAILLISIFTGLGLWQLSRATEKKLMFRVFSERTALNPLRAATIARPNDWRFYRVELSGEYDNAHTILLDNKTHDGKVGYEVYTPFQVTGLTADILVDRGFIPLGASRKELPIIEPITRHTTITGMLNLPPKYVSLGGLTESSLHTWPLRVQYIELRELSSILGRTIFPYVLNLSPDVPGAYDVEWQLFGTKPEKHMGYAIQWFAFAFTLLIIFVALNRPANNRK